METYDFESKHIYRKRREHAIDRVIDVPKALRRVAYLDTKEALDTISYLSRGYRAQNLFAVNNNPAELAHLTMKLDKMGLPRINTIGSDFFVALKTKIPNVDIIDFDGMGNISNKLAYELQELTLLRPNVVYGVTILAGREANSIYGILVKGFPTYGTHTSYGTSVTAKHSTRLFVLLNSIMTADRDSSNECKIHIEKLYWDFYMSISKQPMLWFICKCAPHRSLNQKQFRKLIKNTNCMVVPRCYASA